MKPNSRTEKAPTDVLPNQEMPVKKHTCTKNSIPRAPSKSLVGAGEHGQLQAHPRADLQPTTSLQRKLARRGLHTFPTAKMQLSQERSNIYFVTLLLSGQIYRNGLYFKRKLTTGTWGATIMTLLDEDLKSTWVECISSYCRNCKTSWDSFGEDLITHENHWATCWHPSNSSPMLSPTPCKWDMRHRELRSPLHCCSESPGAPATAP